MRTNDRDDDTVRACPECDSASLTYLKTGSRQLGRTGPNNSGWKCNDCCERFAEPVERGPHGHGGRSAEELLAQFGLEPETDASPRRATGGDS